jgi:hemolysin III
VLHAWAFAVSVVAGAVLCSLTSNSRALAAALVYSLGMVALFGTSATYHRVTWKSVRTRARMKRLDHSMIFVLVAATYTPFAALILSGRSRVVVLSVVWGGALVGIIARIAWLRAPRWAIVPLYIALGWMAVFVMPQLLHRAGVAPVVLLAVGGLAYTVGAVVYASRRPDPSPEVFGYHEVFHALTLLAAASHYVAILLAMIAVGAI